MIIPGQKPCVAQVRVIRGAGGGPDKTIFKSTPILRDMGFEPLAIYMYDPNADGFDVVRRRAQNHDCPLVAIPDNGPLDLNVIRQLRRVCDEHDIRIWHGHDYKANFMGRLLRKLHPMRLVSEVQGWVTESPRMSLYTWVDKKSIGRYDHVITVSADLFEQCLALGIPEERLTLMENAVDVSEFADTDFTRTTKAPSDRIVLGAAGRLSPEKGFSLLIDIVNELADAGQDIELRIAGEGPERDRLMQQIARSHHPDRVELCGHVFDMGAFFASLDVFVLSSLREGLPNVVLEAMAMELPIVATRCGGMTEFVGDSESIVLCDPGQPQQLRNALVTVVQSATERTRLAAASRYHIQQFSFSHRARQVTAIYDQLLNRDEPVGSYRPRLAYSGLR